MHHARHHRDAPCLARQRDFEHGIIRRIAARHGYTRAMIFNVFLKLTFTLNRFAIRCSPVR